MYTFKEPKFSIFKIVMVFSKLKKNFIHEKILTQITLIIKIMCLKITDSICAITQVSICYCYI